MTYYRSYWGEVFDLVCLEFKELIENSTGSSGLVVIIWITWHAREILTAHSSCFQKTHLHLMFVFFIPLHIGKTSMALKFVKTTVKFINSHLWFVSLVVDHWTTEATGTEASNSLESSARAEISPKSTRLCNGNK